MNPFLDRSEPAPPRRSWGQRLVLLLNLALIGASVTLAGLLSYANDRASAINRVALDRSLTEVPELDSGARVINILLVGSDSSANLDPDDPIQIGRQGERLGDVIIVAHIDERSGSVALLSLPRDLWVPIAGTEREDRINRSFLVGGPAKLIDTIEDNFGIPIHHYVNVDFAGFQGLVEAVGSVDIYFETPARDWNVNAKPVPRTQTGFLVAEPGCHTLEPEQALAYVRSRYYQTQDAEGRWNTDPTSDLGRIQRQQDFLQRLLQKAIDLGARNPLVLGNLIDTAVENVAIDSELTPSLLIDLSGTYRSFEPGDLQSYTFPAVDGRVGANRVLIPRVEAAEPLLRLFDGAPFDAPETITIDVVYDASFVGGAEGPTRLPDEIAALVEGLEREGFDVGEIGSGDIDGGLVVRHGIADSQAAGLAVAGLDSALGHAADQGRQGEPPDAIAVSFSGPIPTEEVSGLSGRHVVIAIGADAEVMATAPAPDLVGPTLGERRSPSTDHSADTTEPVDGGASDASPRGPEIAAGAPEGPTRPPTPCA